MKKKRVIHEEIYSFAQVGPLQKAVVFLLSKAIHFTTVSSNRRTIIQSALTLSHSLDSPERSLQVNRINNHFKCIYHQALHAVLSKLHVSPTRTFPSSSLSGLAPLAFSNNQRLNVFKFFFSTNLAEGWLLS